MSLLLARSKSAVDSNSRHQNLPYLHARPDLLANSKTTNPTSKHSRTEALWTAPYRPRHRTSLPQVPGPLPQLAATPTTIPGMQLARPGHGGEDPDARITAVPHLRAWVVQQNTLTKSWNTLSRTRTRSLPYLSRLRKISIRIWPLMMMVTLPSIGPRLWGGSG